ncbi:MAG: Gfo/Idh/MocA family oxidoreductase [Candidatus Omnitrophica bacterium]|nr:Gfo/Idh/MocA family oxidoreductase [Candidatus Omnitrophota bacterium]
MNLPNPVSVVIIGCGGMGRAHLRNILKLRDLTEVVALIEPSEEMINQTSGIFKEHNLSLPPVFVNLDKFFKSGMKSETSFIITPHHLHFSQAKICLENGMDVLLEKPMVMNEKEALDLIDIWNKTGRLLVVAFPGSLSPAIQKAKELITQNSIGKIIQVAALIYQNWRKNQTGKWRQVPEVSGGGFLFDTGSHMINTVVDILGDEVEEVFAIQDNRGTPVEICSAITIRTAKGILVNLTGAGDSIGCDSEIFIFGTKGVIRTGAWGEKLQMRREGEDDFSPVEYSESTGVWEQFLKVREGKLKNPCPPEIGLRFARLMDMIRASASRNKKIK